MDNKSQEIKSDKHVVNTISNSYGLIGLVKLAIFLIRTKSICLNARIIRFPFYLRGRKMIEFGKGLTTGYNCRIEAFVADGDKQIKLKFGNNCQINDYVHISAMKKVVIGDNVLMASNVYISDNSHGSYKCDKDDTDPQIPPIKRSYRVAPVKIGDRVWIGEGAIVMPGVSIGNGAIIGAHSIVNKDIPDNTMAVGSPIRIIKVFNEQTKRWEKPIK